MNGSNTVASDPFALFRMDMNEKTTLKSVEIAIQRAITNNEWLILVFHHVNDAQIGRPQVVNTDFFRMLARYLSEHHVPIVTNAQGISLMARAASH